MFLKLLLLNLFRRSMNILLNFLAILMIRIDRLFNLLLRKFQMLIRIEIISDTFQSLYFIECFITNSFQITK